MATGQRPAAVSAGCRACDLFRVFHRNANFDLVCSDSETKIVYFFCFRLNFQGKFREKFRAAGAGSAAPGVCTVTIRDTKKKLKLNTKIKVKRESFFLPQELLLHVSQFTSHRIELEIEREGKLPRELSAVIAEELIVVSRDKPSSSQFALGCSLRRSKTVFI